jgi:hypothetical protein
VLLLFGTLHGASKQEIDEVGEVLLVALYNWGECAAAGKAIAVRAERGKKVRTGKANEGNALDSSEMLGSASAGT